ncbi:unnamed protein product [Cylicocyclus nassatus]|uniref:Uncharacterized protein n=1 Tax=Cylicocyclus nassatus TaxID=53992 RepID=A0AA36DVF2_CYLNA|nr:unnamed protein product [Cylicocyclus nassatus]
MEGTKEFLAPPFAPAFTLQKAPRTFAQQRSNPAPTPFFTGLIRRLRADGRAQFQLVRNLNRTSRCVKLVILRKAQEDILRVVVSVAL